MLATESAPIHPSSRGSFLSIALYRDDVVPGLTRLADEVHRAGAKLSIVLWHGGHNVSFTRGDEAVSASPVPNLDREVPRAITRREIKELVTAYGAATRRCRQAGLDAVEVQTATGYLLGSFLNPALNHRTDEYGGSLDNRLRIVREVMEAVRNAAGSSLAVGVRTSTAHHIPGAPIDYTLDESVAAMKRLAGAGLVDWVSLLAGSRWAGHETIPPMHRPRRALTAAGARFRRELGVPIIVAGRIRTPAEAEAMLAEGAADVIARDVPASRSAGSPGPASSTPPRGGRASSLPRRSRPPAPGASLSSAADPPASSSAVSRRSGGTT
jgi:2,4-dienoyl-CoA reductase-like NADH-dependent reductase (Old Yellow Enzyme family)